MEVKRYGIVIRDGVVSIRYGALGKAIVDAHSKSFVDGSWTTYFSKGSGE